MRDRKSGGDQLRDRIRRIVGSRPEAPPKPERTSVREPQYKEAVLIFPGGERMKVVIRDLSEGGARVEFFVRAQLPPEVVLTGTNVVLNRRASVVWQSLGVAGLKFLDP